MFPETIETDRLRLTRLCRDRVSPSEFYAVAGRGQTETIDEETQFVSWNPHEHPKESADVLDSFEEAWDEGESATYAIYPREGEPGSGELAGNTGLNLHWETQRAELGIWLRKPFWGRGYSGERAAALLEVAFDRLDLEVVSVAHVPENDNSQRAIERYVDRFGGRREGRLRNELRDSDGRIHDVVRYSISCDEWASAQSDSGRSR